MFDFAISSNFQVRCVFIIDPKNVLRASIYYPLNVGRNFDEIERVVRGLQLTDKHSVACPANWRPGDAVIQPPPSMPHYVFFMMCLCS